jgi:hypothetical protein
MKIYEFRVDGASPGPGAIVVIADNVRNARKFANAQIEHWNNERGNKEWGMLKLYSEHETSPFKGEGVVFAYDGEY